MRFYCKVPYWLVFSVLAFVFVYLIYTGTPLTDIFDTFISKIFN